MKTLNIVIAGTGDFSNRYSTVFDFLNTDFGRNDVIVLVHSVSTEEIKSDFSDKFDFAYVSNVENPTFNSIVSDYMDEHIESIKSIGSITEDNWWCFINANITHLHNKWFDVFCEYVCDNAEIDFDVVTGLCVKLENSPEGLVVKRFTNDGAWQGQLVEEIGKFDMNLALRSNVFEIQNSFISEKVIADVGVFKPDIPKMYDYEYSLRVLNAGYTVSAIPKLVFYQLSESMTQKELEWCGNIARREFFFLPEDNRNIGELYGSFEDSKI